MFIFTTLVTAAVERQFDVIFLNDCQPHLLLRSESFDMPRNTKSPASTMGFLNFLHSFFYLSNSNPQFRALFHDHKLVLKQCWFGWIDLVNHGHPHALIGLIDAYKKSLYSLENDKSLIQKFVSLESLLKKDLQCIPQPKDAFSSRQYKFNQITTQGLEYLKTIIQMDTYFFAKCKFWDKRPQSHYTQESQNRALRWISGMSVPVQDALVGQFKSLEFYFPDICYQPYVTPASSSTSSTEHIDGGSEGSKSDNSVEETHPFLRQRKPGTVTSE